MNCQSQSGEHNLTFISGVTDPKYINCITSDTTPVDFTIVDEVKAEVRTAAGTLVATYILGDGIRIADDNNAMLILFESPMDIPVGTYKYDLFITFSADVIKRPLWGLLTVVNRITQ